MGVYIKDMEMPKTCGKCKLKSAIDCEKWKHVRSVALDRNRGCPLVPVPPHGRLIDEKSLIDKVIAKYLKFERKGKLVFAAAEIKQDICDLISDAPTIIPAEEGE